MAKKLIAVRLPEDLVAEIHAQPESVTKFIEDALRSRLNWRKGNQNKVARYKQKKKTETIDFEAEYNKTHTPVEVHHATEEEASEALSTLFGR